MGEFRTNLEETQYNI